MAVQKVCLGVEIGQDKLKVALVEPERRYVIKVDVIPVSGDSIDEASNYASIVGSWVRSNLLPKIDLIAVTFSVCDGIMRLVAIPKEVENVREYVNWEFTQATGSKMNDYQADVVLYPNPKKPERAIVTAMQTKLVNYFCSPELVKSGFSPRCLMADVCALLNLLECSEGLSSPKCILKADKRNVVAVWGDETGPLAIRLLANDNISSRAIVDILESGFKEVSKAKRNVKICGELSADVEFMAELAAEAKKELINTQLWDSLPKFSFEKSGNFSDLSQCLGAIGVTLCV
ncbi:MAG: hypothetical protein LBU89_09035 [Fibromonadaceae bacterium]|jgi:hypothetical protein|nr:hypothetical protein [Fibromonadaceae bacterium]